MAFLRNLKHRDASTLHQSAQDKPSSGNYPVNKGNPTANGSFPPTRGEALAQLALSSMLKNDNNQAGAILPQSRDDR
jgi:hypothetical protein